jgi:hypothetical protein
MTSQPPPDPYGQPQQPDPYAPGSPAPGQPYQQPGQPYQQPGQPYQQPGQPYQQPGQPYQQPGYPPSGYPPPPPTGSTGGTNVMAILALVFAFVFWPAGIVCGHIAKRQIAQRGEEGAGLATAGLVLSYVFGGLTVLCCGLGIAASIADTTV